MSWRDDKSWSDRFLPEIKAIIGMHLIGEIEEEDQERNTDLVVLKLDAVRVACRIRRHRYLDGYADEFTIRAGRPSGVKTELTKIIEGWGDYIFYGFSDEAEEHLARWFLGDLCVVRLWINRSLVGNQGRLPGRLMSNCDGSSEFLALKVSDLPLDFIKANGGGAGCGDWK